MSVFELFISVIFVNNIVLAQYLGNCPYLGLSLIHIFAVPFHRIHGLPRGMRLRRRTAAYAVPVRLA